MIESATGSALVDRFSLLQGGPIYRFQVLAHLALPDRWQVVRRAFILVLLTWLPLFTLSWIQGQALGTHDGMTFLDDYAVNIRFLITLPLLIVAEMVIDPRLRQAVQYFLTSGLVTGTELPAFEESIRKINRLRDAWLSTSIIIVAALVPAFLLLGKEMTGSGAQSWHVLRLPAGNTPSLAGWWFAAVSAPIYRLLMFRWVWVLIMWAIFLTKVSRLRLNCIPTHPDKAAGLGFLLRTQQFFGLLGFAGSAVIAGGFANKLAYQGATLFGLKFLMITCLVLILAIVIAPLLVMTPRLLKIRERGLLEYGAFDTRFVRDFHTKWLAGPPPADEPLVSTPDISALADLSAGFELVDDMKVILVDKQLLLGLGVPIAFPLIALALAVSPTDKLIQEILKLLV
jgi:hypothetical protein